LYKNLFFCYLKVSWCNWSFCDKWESSAALNSGACGNGGWNNTSTSGTWIKNHLLSPADNWGGGAINQSPTVSMTLPAHNSSYVTPASITLSATAADIDGTISKVQFFNGTTLIGTVTSAPYTFVWAGVTTGTYNITAKATDNGNAVTSSTAITVTVRATNVNQNPTVSITTPIHNAQFVAPISMIVSATASDPDGNIAKVEFFNGTTLLRTVTTAPYSFSWTNLAAGTYNLTAKATDNLNATTTSSTIQIIVNQSNTNVNLIGVNCVNQNDITVFELNSNQRTNATNYNWWCNGSTQSIVQVAGQPYKATFSFGQWFTGGNVCVGVNYSQSPWYQQFCKMITRCARPTIGIAVKDEGTTTVMRVVYPNPSTNGFNFTPDVPLQSLRVIDLLGRERLIFNLLDAYQTLNFGENLPTGVYFLEIKEVNQPIELVKIVKSI
jgi:Bacterial Ig domain/Secretion system C-terminal sorting domain